VPARTAWERARAMLAVLLAAWLFWLVLRAACLAIFAQRDPRVVGQLRPTPVLALLHEARDLPADAPEARAAYARAARADPLAPEPFRDAARAAAAAGDPVRALHLLEAARDRAPRAATIQLELLRLYVQLGMADAAIDAADRAMRLARGPGVAQDLAPALPGFAIAHGGGDALARALARWPDWARHLAGRADAAALSPEGLAQAIADEAEQDPVRRERAARAARLVALLDRGAVAAAAQAFDADLAADGVADGRGASEPYDRDFRALPGPPPLNWRVRGGAGGTAAIRFDDGARDGYLRADLTGAGGAALAEQTMLLPPGRYALHARARALGERDARGAAATWQVTCRASGVTLAALPVPAGARWDDAATAFAVPVRGCAAQRLALVPGSGGVAGALAIDAVRVVPLP
jgi:hypothetical protein